MDQVYAGHCTPGGKKSEEAATSMGEAENVNASEEFRAIFENSQTGIMLLKHYRLIFRANRRLADILGYDSPEQMVGMNVRDLHLSEQRYRQYEERHYQQLTKGVQIQVEYQLKRKDGSPVWCSLSGKAIDSNDPPDLNKGVIWCVDDISRRKAAENELVAQRATLTKMFESAPYVMMLVDTEGRVTNINHRGVNFSERSKDQILGLLAGEALGCLNSFHGGGCGKTSECGLCPLLSKVIRTFETGQGVDDAQGRISVRRSQTDITFDILISTALVRDEDSDKVLVTVNDITERKKADAIAERRTRELGSLHKLGISVNATLSVRQIVSAALRGIMEAVKPDLVFLFRRHEDQLTLEDALPAEASEALSAGLHRVGECLCGLALEGGAPVYSADIHHDARCTLDECKLYGMKSICVLPVGHGDESIGVIGLASASGQDFEARAGFLETLAHQVAVALSNALLYEVALTEVSDRKRVEKALEESKERLAQILEFLPDPTLAIDLEGKVIVWNKAFEEMTGIKSEDIRGKGNYEYSLPIYGYRRSILIDAVIGRGDGILVQYSFVQRDGDILLAECAMPLKDGEIHALSCKARPLYDSNGKIIGAIESVRDVTELKKTQEMLKESEKRYRSVIDNIQDVFYRTDNDGVITMISPSGLRIYGASREEMIGMHVQGLLMYPSEREKMLEKLGQDGVVRDYELTLRQKDGSPWHASLTSSLIKDEQSNILGVEGVIRDINARKRAEEELRVSEKRLRRAELTARTGNWEFIRGSGKVFSSEGARIVYGLENRELSIAEVQKLALPEYRAMLDTALRDLLENGKPYNVEFKIRRANDGKILDIHSLAEYSPELGVVFGVIQDISERKRFEEALKESELRHRTLLQNLPQKIFQKDNHSVYLACNENFAADFAMTPEQIIGKTDYELCPLDLAERRRKDDERVMESETTEELEVPYVVNGLERWANIVKTPVRDAQSRVTGVLGIAFDITERKRAEEEKDKLRAQLIQAQRMESVGRLAGGVAHDFNNMLSVILGRAELALQSVDPTHRAHKSLNEILKAAHRSADLTRQLLAFARKQTISPKVIDLNETVHEILKILRRLIGEDIDLAWIPGKDLFPVKIDPGQIDQVLANLCVNGRDSISGVGKVTIETGTAFFDNDYCATHAGFSPGEFAMIAVSDNGCGMDAKTLQFIFEPFFTTKEVGKGTGLGLATVYGIVKQNNGFINVYSEPGQGTTFKLYFPRASEQARDKPTVLLKKDLEGKETVLLVEDEEPILALGETILREHGYKVLAAQNPTQALKMVENCPDPIQLLITDVVMPDMNGKELRDRLSKIKPGMKTIFMSGYTANVIAHHGVLDEKIDFLQKPFSIKALLEKVRVVLDRG